MFGLGPLPSCPSLFVGSCRSGEGRCVMCCGLWLLAWLLYAWKKERRAVGCHPGAAACSPESAGREHVTEQKSYFQYIFNVGPGPRYRRTIVIQHNTTPRMSAFNLNCMYL